MIKYVNINNQIRTFLAQKLQEFYNETGNKIEALSLYNQWVEELKMQNNQFYQQVVGLCFSDACRLLHFFRLHNKLSQEREQLLARIDRFVSFDEIEDIIEEEPRYFNMMIQAPLKFQLHSLRNQASMLLMGETVTSHFDKFHELEKHAIFDPITLNDIRRIYEKYGQKDNKGLQIAFERLIVLSIGNHKAFYDVLAQLVDAFYKLSKYIEQHSIINLREIHKFVIVNIESRLKENLLYEIAYNEELLMEILMVYLSSFPIYENSYEEDTIDKQKEI